MLGRYLPIRTIHKLLYGYTFYIITKPLFYYIIFIYELHFLNTLTLLLQYLGMIVQQKTPKTTGTVARHWLLCYIEYYYVPRDQNNIVGKYEKTGAYKGFSGLACGEAATFSVTTEDTQQQSVLAGMSIWVEQTGTLGTYQTESLVITHYRYNNSIINNNNYKI